MFEHLQDVVVPRYTPASADVDSTLDVRAVFQRPHYEIALPKLPAILRPARGRLGLRDYEKVFATDARPGGDIFDERGIDRTAGALVIVRPDQYVAHVLPLDGFTDLNAFLAGFLIPA